MKPFLAVFLLGLLACGSVEKAAAKDPMKCERDPSCNSRQQKNRDCATQCSDDPACMDRCREMQQDGLGHK